MNENETKIVIETNDHENLNEFNAPLNQADADKLGYARVLTPEDYVDRTPHCEEEKRTLGKSILRLLGKK
jgi:hypothetical protein